MQVERSECAVKGWKNRFGGEKKWGVVLDDFGVEKMLPFAERCSCAVAVWSNCPSGLHACRLGSFGQRPKSMLRLSCPEFSTRESRQTLLRQSLDAWLMQLCSKVMRCEEEGCLWQLRQDSFVARAETARLVEDFDFPRICLVSMRGKIALGSGCGLRSRGVWASRLHCKCSTALLTTVDFSTIPIALLRAHDS